MRQKAQKLTLCIALVVFIFICKQSPNDINKTDRNNVAIPHVFNTKMQINNRIYLTRLHPQGLKPVHIIFDNHKDFREIKCDIPCFWSHGTGIMHSISSVEIPSISIIASMEGEHYYPQLMNHKSVFSYSLESQVPITYANIFKNKLFENLNFNDITLQNWQENNIQTIPNKGAINKVLFMARNCHSNNHREDIVKSMMKRNIIHSASSCLRNIQSLDSPGISKVKIMARYKFYAAFENGNSEDYITEKLWLALEAGTLPIFYGSHSVYKFIPDKNAIINIDDFNTVDDLVDYILYLTTNNTAYELHHAWRHNPLPIEYLNLLGFEHVSWECRTCRWISSKRDNLLWNHTLQVGTIP